MLCQFCKKTLKTITSFQKHKETLLHIVKKKAYLFDKIIKQIPLKSLPPELQPQCESRKLEPDNRDFQSNLQSHQIKERFLNTISGYHSLQSSPIKESIWETINSQIVSGILSVSDMADGNHVSGKDMCISGINISNKTAIIKKNGKISISSYRLTKVCDKKSHGDPHLIKKEIDMRDSSFEYYSILLRTIQEEGITYYWAMIPKTHNVFELKASAFIKKYNKKGGCVGWTNTHASITFSMSSQLWFHFDYQDIKDCIVQTTFISKDKMGVLSYRRLIA